MILDEFGRPIERPRPELSRFVTPDWVMDEALKVIKNDAMRAKILDLRFPLIIKP